jgi:hypothetical protein
MNKAIKITLHLIFLCGLIFMYLLPANKYDWMQEMAPSIPVNTIENPSANNAIFTFLLLCLMAATQWILLIKTSNNREKIASMLLIGFAIYVWFSRFW